MFHNQLLAKAVAELDPHTIGFKTKADKISDDIKALEKYLSDRFLGIEIGINVLEHKIDTDHMKLFELAGMGSNLKFLLREFLIWGKDESSQKFRLLYETHSLKGNKTSGYHIWPDRRPLIECTLFERLHMYSKIPLLVDHIKNCLMWD